MLNDVRRRQALAANGMVDISDRSDARRGHSIFAVLYRKVCSWLSEICSLAE